MHYYPPFQSTVVCDCVCNFWFSSLLDSLFPKFYLNKRNRLLSLEIVPTSSLSFSTSSFVAYFSCLDHELRTPSPGIFLLVFGAIHQACEGNVRGAHRTLVASSATKTSPWLRGALSQKRSPSASQGRLAPCRRRLGLRQTPIFSTSTLISASVTPTICVRGLFCITAFSVSEITLLFRAFIWVQMRFFESNKS